MTPKQGAQVETIEAKSRAVLRTTDAVFSIGPDVLCAVAGHTRQVKRAAEHLDLASATWGVPVSIWLVPEPVPAKFVDAHNQVKEGVHRIDLRGFRIAPGPATPVPMDPALALARSVASELRKRNDELDAENRRLQLALGVALIEKERLEKLLNSKKSGFKRS